MRRDRNSMGEYLFSDETGLSREAIKHILKSGTTKVDVYSKEDGKLVKETYCIQRTDYRNYFYKEIIY